MIDIAIFVVFLVINLIVGLFYSRQVNSIRDYSVGRKEFSTATLTSTIVVSWIRGWYIFYMLEHIYKDGLYFIIVIIGAAICLLLIGQLAARMGEFLNNLSVAEAMGDMYGKAVQIITAISGILGARYLKAFSLIRYGLPYPDTLLIICFTPGTFL